jgi:uncharacterized coiled-coil protein SlyX
MLASGLALILESETDFNEVFMTDLDVVLQKLENIELTQAAQGQDIKELSKGFTVLAVQSEQLTNLNTQTTALWRKYDSLTGPDSIQEKIREHQKGCPRDEMHRTFGWVWKVIGFHSVLILALIGWVISISRGA